MATQPLSMSDNIFELNAVGVQSPLHVTSGEGCTDQRAAHLGHQDFGVENPLLHGYNQQAVKQNVLEKAKKSIQDKQKTTKINSTSDRVIDLQPVYASNSSNMLIGYREIEAKEGSLGTGGNTSESGGSSKNSGVFNGASRIAQNFSRRNEDGTRKDSVDVGLATSLYRLRAVWVKLDKWWVLKGVKKWSAVLRKMLKLTV